MKKKLLKISIIGRTNAGKSTLINNFTGETISIVNKKINTTKDLIIGIKTLKEYQFIFYDTPGTHQLKAKTKSNQKTYLWQGIDQSDVILFMVDSKNLKLNELFNSLLDLLKLNKNIIIVFNKIDLINPKVLLPYVNDISIKYNLQKFFFISAKYNSGINDLLKYLKKISIVSKWEYDEEYLSNKDEIFLTNECTRNSILLLINKEIPYNIEINNKEFKYLKNNKLNIRQEIIIANERYKKIIIGKEGKKIKSIRENSQKQINKILKLNSNLFLEIVLKK